ncbi:hypothetical protein STEG23_012386 [Scotinomys teguina]
MCNGKELGLEASEGTEKQTESPYNQVVTPTTAAVPDVVSLLEQMTTSPGTWNPGKDGSFGSKCACEGPL